VGAVTISRIMTDEGMSQRILQTAADAVRLITSSSKEE
jgi:TetR/AcrR family transcriptional regulator, transcriptional repressor for nem operon